MIQIFSDFDGTITNRDSIVFLTETFGGGREFRHNVLAELEKEKLDVFETIQTELASVKASWAKASCSLLQNISVDPAFFDFVDWCHEHSHPIVVVSSGIRQVLSLFIGELDVPFYAHPVEITKNGWLYQKDEQSDKACVLREAQSNGRIVYIGDGISDLSVVNYVDFLFAKHRLAKYCVEFSIPFFPFESFCDVQRQLEKLLENRVHPITDSPHT